ncbi:hypothetical protein [Streptomyces sp. NPDC047042]|uniref:hypothetical protein n=1 Tax=Streptomyces sp. NPDC047042 TaxID=3154807 RepID=UPI0033EE5099
MSRIPPARTTADRARVHIKALIDEAKHQTGNSPMPAQMFFSGMLSGLAAAVEVIDGGTAEGSMEAMVQRLSATIGQAYLDGQLPPQQPAADTDHQLSPEEESWGVQGWMALDLHQALGWSLNGVEHQGRKSWSDWWAELLAEVRILTRTDRLRDERTDRTIGEEGPAAERRTAARANIHKQLDRIGRRGIIGASAAELLRNQVEAEMREGDTARAVAAGNLRHVKTLVPELEQAQAAIARVRRLSEMTIEHSVRVDARHQALDTLQALDGVSSPADAMQAAGTPVMTGVTAGLARSGGADVQRVTALYEQWVKAGPPPLGVSVSRWWDRRLVELRTAVLGDDAEQQTCGPECSEMHTETGRCEIAKGRRS